MPNNVYSHAKIVKDADKKEESTQDYKLGTFVGGSVPVQSDKMKEVATLNNREINGNVDPVLIELKNLANEIGNIKNKLTNIENSSVAGRDIDKQVIEAIKDLKHYASFFEQATFQLESKILKTAMSIAKKIISIEVGENSSKIAKETISNLLNKIKTASKITIHLNPKDYAVLKNELQLESYIEIQEDSNVTLGGVVIASDLGNFDGNIEAKVSSMLESLDSVM